MSEAAVARTMWDFQPGIFVGKGLARKLERRAEF